ncbi:MAG: hypothetical protein JXD19_04665 [Deltaproteobacteria bacterium]|nr:hypothetical protein [Deltaproteobacteria bacterium]
MGAGNLSEVLRAVTVKSNDCSMAPQIRHLPPWKVTRNEAVAIQEKLLPLLLVQTLHVPARLVAGVDVAYSKMVRCLYGAIVVLQCCGDYRLPEPVWQAHLLATRLRDQKLKD